MKKFPQGKYGRQTLTFFPAPYKAPLRAFAALVFAWQGEEVLLANIEGRGWCIPSGRVEPFESSVDAVAREAMEEAGAELLGLQYIGCYQIRERANIRWADCFTASVDQLTDAELAEESHGRTLVTMDQLPDIYHEWNELTDLVFKHSREILLRSIGPNGNLPGASAV